MATEPTVKVEVAFASAPGAASPTWTDVSAYLVSGKSTRGRQRELDRFQAGALELVLRNEDRRFDPLYTSGAYYPNVKPMKRVRVTPNWATTDYPLFDGYIDSWDQAYDIPRVATTIITATDLFKVLNAIDLPASAYVVEVQADSPTHWWRLGDPTGSTVIVDSIAGLNPAPFGLPSLGTASLITRDSNTAMTQPDANSGYALAGPLLIPAGTFPSVTFEVTVRTATGGTVLSVTNTDGTASISLGVNAANGRPFFTVFNGTSFSAGSPSTINDGSPHHLAGTWDGTNVKIYVDGVLQGTTAGTAGTYATTQELSVGNIGAGFAGSHTQGLVGDIDEAAIYLADIGATRIAAHSAGRAIAWSGDTPVARAGRILDLALIPAGLRNLDTGSSILQSTSLGISAFSALQKVADSEFGELWITADGKVRLVGRTGLLNIAPVATFGDAGAELGYVDMDPDYSDQVIRNKVTISRENGVAQTSSDATSITNYLTHSYVSDGLQHNSDQTSKDAADFFVSEYKDPLYRMSSLEIAPQGDPTNLYPQVLGRELNDRITIKRRPQGVGSAISQVSVIEGISHTFGPKAWRTSWQVSPAYAGADATTGIGFLQLNLSSGPGLDNLRLYF